MSIQDFYIDFDFTDAIELKNKNLSPELEEIAYLETDKVYFSGDYPAILFKEIESFDDENLREIARIQHLIWNYRKITFLFVLSNTEVRIYNCHKKPFNQFSSNGKISKELEKFEIAKSVYKNLQTLEIIKQLFSRVAVDCGSLWITENSLRAKISLQERIDKYLIKSLLNAAKKLKQLLLPDEIIHSLLMRSIFIMYLEDKGAAKETNLYKSIIPNSSSYLDILDNKIATYSIFKKVEEHFNGNVFPLIKDEEKKVNETHLSVIKKCLFDGDLLGTPKLFSEWRLFRFDIIQIEMLSEIYEHFLEEFKEKKKEEGGQYYTPPALVELILNQKLKVIGEKKWEFKILDPACGSGIFLVESFKRLVKRWKNAHPKEKIKFSDLREILEKNIFGIEYDPLAIRVTAFSLYLTLLEFLNPRTLWIDKRYKFPNLIFDPEDRNLTKQGKNLFRQDTIGEINTEKFERIDLIIGNPPFGTKINLQSIKEYCIKNDFGQDMVIPFLHKATKFTSEGSIALIFNSKVLTNTEGTFQNFRKWLFNDTHVEKIYNFSIFRKTPKTFGGQLFSSAVGPISILFYQKKLPHKQSLTIEYWAPKSYVKTNLIEGVVIDATDIKFLPRDECKKPDTKIWKIAMWGNLEDFKLINRLNQLPNLFNLLEKEKVNKGLGLQFLDNSTENPIHDLEIPKLLYINPDQINRFYTSKEDFTKLTDGLTEKSKIKYNEYYKKDIASNINKIDVFRRIGKKEAFYAPHVLVKEGLSDKKVCASFLDDNCSFNSKVFGISGASKNFLKSITCYLNSNIATYYLFLISASIGIEREEIKPNEIYDLPIIYDQDCFKILSNYLDQIKERVNNNYPFKVDISDIEKSMNQTIIQLFSLSHNEKILIDDFMNITMSLLFDGYKSFALKPISAAENKTYASLLCKQLNEYLMTRRTIISASVFNIEKNVPLNIVKLSFSKRTKGVHSFGSEIYEKYISEINKYSISALAKTIYIQKQIKYFDDESIYIIKPNQKRFWSRSMAINDSKELINEILKMS